MSSEESAIMDNSEKLSALKDNIKNKGSNSYYYAHGNTANGPKWDGQEQPRLLAKVASTEKPIEIISFNDYAWMDESKSVKIYIDFEDAASFDDEKITVLNTENSVEFTLHLAEDRRRVLRITELCHPIDTSSIKKKTDKFVITLKKREAVTWHSLKKKE